MATAVPPSIFPLEFMVVGVPLSLQAKPASKERWKGVVREAAELRVKDKVELVWLEDEPLAITIFYFPTAPMMGDIDNIVKPILDALEGSVYLDDRLIERVLSQKFEPEIDWSFSAPTEDLTAALDKIYASDAPAPVVYVRIDNNLSWRRL